MNDFDLAIRETLPAGLTTVSATRPAPAPPAPDL
jgi:hypothetical protein